MIPREILALDVRPTTASGKIDRKALTSVYSSAAKMLKPHRPSSQQASAGASADPSDVLGVIQQVLTDISGAHVLRDSRLVDIGLTSLDVVTVTAALRKQLGIPVPEMLVMKSQTVEDLALGLGLQSGEPAEGVEEDVLNLDAVA